MYWIELLRQIFWSFHYNAQQKSFASKVHKYHFSDAILVFMNVFTVRVNTRGCHDLIFEQWKQSFWIISTWNWLYCCLLSRMFYCIDAQITIILTQFLGVWSWAPVDPFIIELLPGTSVQSVPFFTIFWRRNQIISISKAFAFDCIQKFSFITCQITIRTIFFCSVSMLAPIGYLKTYWNGRRGSIWWLNLIIAFPSEVCNFLHRLKEKNGIVLPLTFKW